MKNLKLNTWQSSARWVDIKNALGFRKLRQDQSGQMMSEYVILIILVALICIPVMKWLPAAVQGYTRAFYYCLSRPIP